MIDFYRDILANHWTPVGIAVFGGYGLRLLQNIISDLIWQAREEREQRQIVHDTVEIERILAGIEEVSQTQVMELERPISRSPLVAPNMGAPDWGPAYFLEGPKHLANEWPQIEETIRVPWWTRVRNAFIEYGPRTPEQVAAEVYEQEAGISPYRARHRAEDYTPQELKIVLTPTTEFPKIRELSPHWDRVPVPQPVEVFSG